MMNNRSHITSTIRQQLAAASPAAPVDGLLDESSRDGEFSSAVYAVWHAGTIVHANARGHAVRSPRIINATRDTIYDLASLTKPLVTTLLCAIFIERGTLKLDAPVSHYLPAFDTPDKRLITTRHLLTHTGGLPAWRPLCLLTKAQSAQTLSHIARLELAYRPGAQVVYSDLGFITLGMMCERIGETSLATLAAREIFEPLNLTHTFFNPPASLRETIAASESHGNLYERDMSATHDDTTDDEDDDNRASCFRTRPIWGEVHDGNAHFLGGLAGHAGLFSNIAETVTIATQFLPRHSNLLHDPATFRLFDTDMTPDLNEARAMGWQLAATPESTAGTSLPPSSFGHLGFTGTSLWIDGAHENIFALLTNRTHDHPLPFANINRTRRRFHTTANELIHRLIGSIKK